MTREQALRKIMACLRLSQSANPHEAASALRQAKAMMVKYGLTEADAAAADIICADAPTRSRGAMAPESVTLLAQVIADGYRCQVLVTCYAGVDGRGGRTRIEFYGLRSDAQVSAYAFAVLRRQMEADKAKSTRRYKASRRAQAGELFAKGWILAVRDLFPREEVDAAHAAAIQRAIALQQPEKKDVDAKQRTTGSRERDLNLQLAGYLAGKKAHLRRGVNAPQAAALEHLP